MLVRTSPGVFFLLRVKHLVYRIQIDEADDNDSDDEDKPTTNDTKIYISESKSKSNSIRFIGAYYCISLFFFYRTTQICIYLFLLFIFFAMRRMSLSMMFSLRPVETLARCSFLWVSTTTCRPSSVDNKLMPIGCKFVFSFAICSTNP